MKKTLLLMLSIGFLTTNVAHSMMRSPIRMFGRSLTSCLVPLNGSILVDHELVPPTAVVSPYQTLQQPRNDFILVDYVPVPSTAPLKPYKTIKQTQNDERFQLISFDPTNTKLYQQMLTLLHNDKHNLLDYDEDPKEVMDFYVKGMARCTDEKSLPYYDLQIKTIVNTRTQDLVGFITYQNSLPGTMVLRTMAISPKYRGHGFAKQLFAVAEQDAKKKNISKTWGIVYLHNQTMRKLLTGLGYTVDAELNGRIDNHSIEIFSKKIQ